MPALRIPRDDGWLLLRSFWWVAVMRLSLWVLPFRYLCPATDAEPRPRPDAAGTGMRVGAAVRRAGRYIPRATCLTQALAACRILSSMECPARLEIGVLPGEGSLEAHAWVECGGSVIVGGEVAGKYHPLKGFPGSSS